MIQFKKVVFTLLIFIPFFTLSLEAKDNDISIIKSQPYLLEINQNTEHFNINEDEIRSIIQSNINIKSDLIQFYDYKLPLESIDSIKIKEDDNTKNSIQTAFGPLTTESGDLVTTELNQISIAELFNINLSNPELLNLNANLNRFVAESLTQALLVSSNWNPILTKNIINNLKNISNKINIGCFVPIKGNLAYAVNIKWIYKAISLHVLCADILKNKFSYDELMQHTVLKQIIFHELLHHILETGKSTLHPKGLNKTDAGHDIVYALSQLVFPTKFNEISNWQKQAHITSYLDNTFSNEIHLEKWKSKKERLKEKYPKSKHRHSLTFEKCVLATMLRHNSKGRILRPNLYFELSEYYSMVLSAQNEKMSYRVGRSIQAGDLYFQEDSTYSFLDFEQSYQKCRNF